MISIHKTIPEAFTGKFSYKLL